MATKPKGLGSYKSPSPKRLRLSQETRDALAHFAGLDRTGSRPGAAAEMLEEVEAVLSLFAWARHEELHGPGPAAEREMLNGVLRAARELERALSGLSAVLWWSLRQSIPATDRAWSLYRPEDGDESLAAYVNGPDTQDLVKLCAVADRLRSERQARSSGRRRENARDAAIFWMVDAFLRHADRSPKEKTYRTCLLDFVHEALDAANLPVPENLDKLWLKIQRVRPDVSIASTPSATPTSLGSPRSGPRSSGARRGRRVTTSRK